MPGSLKHAALHWISGRPHFFRAYCGSRKHLAHMLVQKDTDLVIEGYPRCANSFATLAFRRAQPGSVRLAHHLHASAQIILGVRYGLPVLVLIREPLGAAASLITRHPELSVGQAVAQYLSFYGAVQQLQAHLVLSKFETVTTDYASAIRALNQRFGTAFVPYINTAENDRQVFDAIDRLGQLLDGGEVHRVARPSEAKRELLNAARARVAVHPQLAHAQRLYLALEPRAV